MLATDSAGQLKQKKRINRKLTQAANANAFAVLNVVSEELKYMNGVNWRRLSIALPDTVSRASLGPMPQPARKP